MLIKANRKTEILLLIATILVIFVLEYFFKLKAGIRINLGNLFIGLVASIFAFLIFNLSNFFLLLIRGQKFNAELISNRTSLSNLDLVSKAVFISAVEEFFIRVLIFGSLLKMTVPVIAYLIAALISYLINFSRNKKYLAISYAVFGLFSCFLYQLHRSYFLIFVSSCFFWILWLTYQKSGYFNRNCLEVLNIRKIQLFKKIKT